VQKLSGSNGNVVYSVFYVSELKVSQILCLRLEDKLEEVDKEVKVLQQQSNIQAELDLQRESKAMKESEVRKL
jgi:hypothetical protein